jgi:glycosyltransferase 2 family protein
MAKSSTNWKLYVGIALSLLFMYLAFRKVDMGQMASAFASANYWYILPVVIIMFFSHWLRSVRWRYLLMPVQTISVTPLFNSLMIGYLFNTFLPAHLGEFVRAYVLSRKESLPASAVFGTIVIERVIDVLALLALMALTMIVYPFPDWVKKSGYLTLAFIVVLFIMLIAMKRYSSQALALMDRLTKPMSSTWSENLHRQADSFLQGIVPLQRPMHYIIVAALSVVIWLCYGVIFQVILHSFNFVATYNLPWTAALVLLVITTISILVPSSPGYVGTYHYLCQLALGLFSVPTSPALTFAIVMHGINFLPILIVGFIILSKEGLSVASLQKTVKE